MKSLRLVACAAAAVLAAGQVCQGQTNSPVTKPGLYKGTMTISSTNYGSVKTPVSSSTPIVARVTESLYPGEIQVVIRLKPEFVLDDPLRDYFRLEYDPNFEGYVLFQEDPGGTGSGRGVVMERGPSRIAATLTGFQYSERGTVQSQFTTKVVLTRVGP